MRRSTIFLFLMVTLILCNTGVYAEEERFAVGIKAGTLGIGGEGIIKLSDEFNVRIGVNRFDYGYDGTESDVDYDFDAQLFTIAGLLDWFPFENGFRVSAGIMSNQNELEAEAQSSATYTVGNTTYTSSQVGTLNGNVDFNDVAPYVGIGWGTPFGKESPWSLNFDLGAMYQGSADVELTANGALAQNSTFLADLEREENEIEDSLEGFQFYPVVALGLAYRF